MGKIQKKETGFSAVEALLILVIVAVVGAVGWFVYSKDKTVTSVSSTNSTSKTTTQTTPAKTSGQVVATADKKVQVTLPDTWHVIVDSNNPNADQVISVNKSTHLCDKYNPSNCSATAPCLDSEDTVSCTYEAEFQPKALDPQKDNIWGLTVEKSDMTVSQASEQLLGDLSASNTVEKSSAKINGYDAFYVKVKGGDCSAECYVDNQYFISYNGYLVHFSNREQYTNHSVNPVNQNYTTYSADFSKIVNSVRLSL